MGIIYWDLKTDNIAIQTSVHHLFKSDLCSGLVKIIRKKLSWNCFIRKFHEFFVKSRNKSISRFFLYTIRYTREMTMSVEDVAKNEERKKKRQRQYDQIHKRRSTPEVGAVSILFIILFSGGVI